jgi:iron-sulfur cluster repair protein YtfE (RIC family)
MPIDPSPSPAGADAAEATAAARRKPAERRILAHDHRAIEHVVGRVETTAEIVGTLTTPDLASALRNLLDTVERSLGPHLEWEEKICFAQIDGIAGTAWATRILRVQHDQIHEAVSAIERDWRGLRGEVTHRQLTDLRAHLYRLHALMSAHLEQEELALIPFLEAEGRGSGAH